MCAAVIGSASICDMLIKMFVVCVEMRVESCWAVKGRHERPSAFAWLVVALNCIS